MRNALEDAMSRVPTKYRTAAVKVYLAECISNSDRYIAIHVNKRATDRNHKRTEKNDATTHTSR
jgi:hypothetical protein